MAEGKAWERTNSDGSLNLGSYEVMAATGMIELAYETLSSSGEPPAPGKVRRLASALLEAADRCQAAVRADGHSDRLDNSHTRARGAVRTVLPHYPPPFGQPAEVPAWIERLAGAAADLLKLAVSLVLTEDA